MCVWYAHMCGDTHKKIKKILVCSDSIWCAQWTYFTVDSSLDRGLDS